MAFFVPVLAAGIWGAVSNFILRTLMWLVPWVVRYGLIALGIGAITYIGLDIALDAAIAALQDRYSQIPAELFDILELMGVTDAISIITSAATAAIALKAVTGFTKYRVNKPATLTA